MSYVSVICIVLLLIIPDFHYYIKPKIVFEINSIKFRTGDLFLTRWHSEPLISYNSVSKSRAIRLNSMLTGITTNITNAMLNMGFTYTHCGICIVINNEPYIYECSDALHYTIDKIDHISKKIIVNTPSLLPLSYIHSYRGHVYHYPYIGPDLDMAKIFKFIDIHKNNKLGTINNITFDDIKFMYNNPKNLQKKNSCAMLVSKFINDFNMCDQSNVHTSTPKNIIRDCINSGSHLNEPHLLKNNFSIYNQ